MNRVDRLLAIVLELQAHQRRRAADLAATFEISVRTVYRDILALCEAGVPIISVPGQGYSLVEGYFLPPLQLTPAEALLIVQGLRALGHLYDPAYATAARTATTKIITVLPPPLRLHVTTMQQGMAIIAARDTAIQQGHLTVLREAIVAQRSLRMGYHGRTTPFAAARHTTRMVDPYQLTCVRTVWYLHGFCHLRQSMRNFRVERIGDLTMLDHTFEPTGTSPIPQDATQLDQPICVQVLFAEQIKTWVLEDLPFFVVSTIQQPDGLLAILHVRAITDVVQWILSWGRFARVLEPIALQTLIRDQGWAIQRMYDLPKTLLP
ncbi:MAG TPA: YafY family transcriptional regulator [Herpetosiphon sp.]|uniref:Helix-turn-helix type 11 domain protein n=1 Tax=Herpetosiphon aurantiacus (strain ATCC 23779 / DSM 785 / 114-95) TaxID=316274 RepID=A9AVG2_HERA2|nr:YafY family protein [Herpetosiphon sp.]ABX04653.1 Helix-turn-helix type 11 domain protein [Herpetosiphon aurantiacus DSM 785]HBW48634.1 YafY family transcriptional regulator [Herpetosiphon sp.]